MSRFFITCCVRTDHSVDAEDFLGLFRRYDLDEDTRELPTAQFAKMLSDFDVVEEKIRDNYSTDRVSREFKYFADEYVT